MTEARTKRKALSNYCCIKNHIELRVGMLKNISPGYSSLTVVRFVVIVLLGSPLILALIDHRLGVYLSFEFLFAFRCCCCKVISSPFSS